MLKEIGKKSKIKVHWKVNPYDFSKEKQNNIISKLSKKYSIPKDRIKVDASLAYSPTDYQTIRFNMYNLLDRDDAISSYERYDLPFNWTLTYTHTF